MNFTLKTTTSETQCLCTKYRCSLSTQSNQLTKTRCLPTCKQSTPTWRASWTKLTLKSQLVQLPNEHRLTSQQQPLNLPNTRSNSCTWLQAPLPTRWTKARQKPLRQQTTRLQLGTPLSTLVLHASLARNSIANRARMLLLWWRWLEITVQLTRLKSKMHYLAWTRQQQSICIELARAGSNSTQAANLTIKKHRWIKLVFKHHATTNIAANKAQAL